MAEPAAGLDAQTLATLRTRLEQERDRLVGLQSSSESIRQNLPGDMATIGDVEDFSEMGYDLTVQGTEQALEQNDQRLLAQVDRALLRIEQGSYGISEITGKPISPERLDALPWATTNVGDKPAADERLEDPPTEYPER